MFKEFSRLIWLQVWNFCKSLEFSLSMKFAIYTGPVPVTKPAKTIDRPNYREFFSEVGKAFHSPSGEVEDAAEVSAWMLLEDEELLPTN